MIQINPLQNYINGGARAAITTPPSASLVFDLPGKAIWVKGVKLKGTDHTYTFSHDNYISITNTPGADESEDIKIGINTTLLRQALDITSGLVSATADGAAPMFSNANKATASAATTYNFLGVVGNTLKWYQLPWRNVRINSDSTDVLGVNDTNPLIISSGTGISVTWDSTNKKIVITNTSPDVNHNSDRTGVKLGTVSGTKKTDSTVILTNSTTGLTLQGGTNKFLIGDGTNYIEVPITINHGLGTKNMSVNGTNYAIYTSSNSLPTIIAPTSLAGTGGYVLATNSNKSGLEWVALTVNTDTTVIDVDHHYSPSANASSELTATPTGATAAWSIDVVTGVKIQRDAKGHVTGVTVNSGKLPGNPNTNTWRPIKVSGSEKLGSGIDTGAIDFAAGTGISLSWDATNKKITIVNTAPDVNHNTHYTTSLYIGENNDTKANAASSNPYLKLFDDSVRRSTLRFVAGTGITVGSDANGNITITNSAPDQNHNTDYTTVNKGTAGSTTAVTQVKAASSAGIIFEGGTNKFKVGDGTNYFEIPITISHGLSTKNITINGATYAIYTSASSLPTFVAPGSYAGTGGYILATNSAKNGLEWVAKPVSNVTTTAVVAASATGTSQITAAQTNPYYNLLEGGAVSRSIRFVAGTGITISAATDGQITITNASPDQNHNTDRTGIKLAAVSGTKKTDSTLILANSGVGLSIAGGTNLIKIGDGTNYIEVPITINHGLSTKNMTINGTAYALYTSASSLPTFVAPGSYGTANYILATNSSGNGLTWVAKPTSNVTTTAIVGNSATATSQITAAQTNPYYNLLEGGAVTRSIRFVAGNGITISAATDGLITITNSKPDVNHDTHYVTTMYIGESNDTKSNVVATNPYLKLFDNNTRRSTLRFVAGNGITIGSDASGNITITNSKPDVNHDTHYTTTMFVGENNNTKANAAATNPYLKLFDNDTRRSTLRFVAGTGITIASDANGNITVTNASPDLNHNTDRTGVKLGTVSGTKKTDSTLIITNSSAGLVFQGGTNKFSIGDGTNYIEVPITPSFTVSNKAATIGRSLTTIATINGTDITAKIGDYVAYYHNYSTNPNIDDFADWAYLLTVADSGSYGGGTKASGSHNGFGVLHLHTHAGNYYTQLGLDTNLNRLWIRSANNAASFGAWLALAYTSEIPTVNNASLSLQTAGTTLTVFYANDSTNRTFNVTCANIGAATSGHNHDTRYVYQYPSGGFGNMNDVARSAVLSSVGMTSLSSSSVDNGDMSSWTHFLNISYADGGAGSNSWIFLLACPAGSSNLQFRSRNGGTITNGTAWAIGWTKIAHSKNISNKDATIGTSSTTIATIAGVNITAKIGSYAASSHTHTVKINGSEKTIAAPGGTAVDLGSYLPLTGGTLAAQNSWLNPARLQLLRPDSTAYTDRACVGVTNGNLHIDAYKDYGLYLNYYSSGGAVYFNGSTYYIKGGNYNGNSATASKWQTARTLTIGNTGKSVDGSTNVSWTLAEIGAAASNHTHPLSIAADSGTSSIALAASTKYKLTAGGSTYIFTSTPDEKVRQVPKTDNVNRPLMMINGGTSAGEQVNTSMFCAGIYANASTSAITALRFISGLSTGSHIAGLNGSGVPFNSTAGAGYNMVLRVLGTGGAYNVGVYYNSFDLIYGAQSLIDAGTNSYTHSIQLMNLNGLTMLKNLVVDGNNHINEATSASYRLYVSGNANYSNRILIDTTGRIYPYSTTTRAAGMYGTYDSTRLGHIWSMGTGYTISDDGYNPNSLYGFAYFHTNWSNNASYNTANASKTALGTYAGNHQAGWFINGILYASFGDYIWSRNGFLKNGSNNNYVLLGGGGHKAVSDFATSGHTHDDRYIRAYWSTAYYGKGNYGSMSTETGINSNWWHVLCLAWNDEYRWNSQIALPTLDRNDLYFRSGLDNNSGWGAWKKIWNESNDGAGSGLDADLLDGTHKADLLTAASLGASGNSTTLSITVGGTTKTGSVTVPYATSAGNADTVDSQHANKFAWVYNSSNIQSSSSVTVNDMVSSGGSNATMAMIYAATDNPTGGSSWVHVWSQLWSINSAANWVSQIALGVANGNGMWYRCSSGASAGLAWKRVLDSSNYTEFVNNYYWANVKVSTTSSTTTTPTVRSLSISAQSDTYGIYFNGGSWINNINNSVIFRNGIIRFGTSGWDWDQWAGLSFDGSTTINIGMPDKSIFTANSAKTAGTIRTVNSKIEVYPNGNSNYGEGIRIHSASNGWTTLMLAGSDNTGFNGTSTNSWSLHTNGGNFYLNKATSSTAQAPRLWGRSNGTGWTIGNLGWDSYQLEVAGVTRLQDSLVIGGYATFGTHYITGAAGRIYFGGNFHIDSIGRADTYDLFLNYYAQRAIHFQQDRMIMDSEGKMYVANTGIRRAGIYGIYDSYKIGHIWSMGTSYVIANDGSTFGNLYGLAYKHTNNTTGGTMAGGHQAVWCDNGNPRAAMGYNGFWAAGGFYKNGSNDNYFLLGGGGHVARSSYANASHTHPFSLITDGTCTSTAGGWSHVLSNTYGGSLKSILYMCHGGGYGMHLRGYSTSASVYMLEIYNTSSLVFAVYGDGHAVHGGTVTATHFYEPSDIRLKHDISMMSKSVRKFRFNEDNKLYYGFIAQELETLHPELVDNSGEYKKVNYNSAICYYIAELENKVQKLEDEINKLKNK